MIMVSKPEVLSNILQTLRIKRLEIEQTTTKYTSIKKRLT